MASYLRTLLPGIVAVLALAVVVRAEESRSVDLQPSSATADVLISPLPHTQVNPSPAVVCTPKWQGPNAGWLTNWHVGDESYAAYQNPNEVGCASPFPFKVQNMYWRLTNQTTNTLTVRIEPQIFSVTGTEACPKPGDTLYLGPTYDVQIPPMSTGVVQMPTPGTPCLSGPYFIVAHCPDSIGTYKLGINLDSSQVVPTRACAAYTNYRGPWEDVVTLFHFPGNLLLWTDGTTAATNGCDTGGACCVAATGNLDCDPGDNVDIADLTILIDHMFVSFTPLCCIGEGNTDGLPGIDIADLTRLIDYLFISFTPTAACN